MPRTLILPAERVRRTLSRLACEVIEHNRGAANLVVLGVRSGGVALTEALAAQIQQNEGMPVATGSLDVTAYRDDRDRGIPRASVAAAGAVAAIDDRDVLLVDDVLFTGRTARAALDAVVEIGRPRSIQLLVLVDRGHREYPIQPDFIGRSIKTKHREKVVVEVDEGFSVYVEE
jgi:pyrimidine operon attenuation protein/uracil phosphoribosyltransferase